MEQLYIKGNVSNALSSKPKTLLNKHLEETSCICFLSVKAG